MKLPARFALSMKQFPEDLLKESIVRIVDVVKLCLH